MPYKITKDMIFHKNCSASEKITLAKGTIVKEAHWSEMGAEDLAAFRKLVKRHQARHPNERIGFFHYDGRIRSAVFNKGLRRARGLF